MKLDIKTAIVLGTLLFAIAGFYFTTTSDINALSLKIKGLESENHMQQRRLDSLDKKTNRINKQLQRLNKWKN